MQFYKSKWNDHFPAKKSRVRARFCIFWQLLDKFQVIHQNMLTSYTPLTKIPDIATKSNDINVESIPSHVITRRKRSCRTGSFRRSLGCVWVTPYSLFIHLFLTNRYLILLINNRHHLPTNHLLPILHHHRTRNIPSNPQSQTLSNTFISLALPTIRRQHHGFK